MGAREGRPTAPHRLPARMVQLPAPWSQVRGAQARLRTEMRAVPSPAGAPFRLLAQPALHVRRGSLRRREGWLDEGCSDCQEGWFFATHTGQWQYPGLEAEMLFLDLDRWSEPVSMVSERYRDFLIYNEMVYSKAQLFYEQLRYVVGDDA